MNTDYKSTIVNNNFEMYLFYWQSGKKIKTIQIIQKILNIGTDDHPGQ